MIATSILLLLTASLAESSCIYCVSPFIATGNFARSLDVKYERTAVGEDRCTRNITKVTTPTSCSGPCLTVNVTREGETEPSGVIRDCLALNPRVKRRMEKNREANSTGDACYTQPIKGFKYTATYCSCTGEYCNVQGTPLAAMMTEEAMRAGVGMGGRRGSRNRLSPNGANTGVQSISLGLVALLATRRL